MSSPFMQLYVADYLGDTRHLTTEQHGAYLLLLMAMWRSGGRLPNDPKKLARIVGCTASRWSRIQADVLEFFAADGDDLTNKRLGQELQKAQEKSNQRSVSGIKGAKANALKRLKGTPANDDRLPKHSSEPEPEEGSVDKSTGAESAVVDHDSVAWTDAVALLTKQGGMAEKAGRAFFGKLLAGNKIEARDLLPALATARVNGTLDPQGLLTRHAQAVGRKRLDAEPKRVGWV